MNLVLSDSTKFRESADCLIQLSATTTSTTEGLFSRQIFPPLQAPVPTGVLADGCRTPARSQRHSMLVTWLVFSYPGEKCLQGHLLCNEGCGFLETSACFLQQRTNICTTGSIVLLVLQGGVKYLSLSNSESPWPWWPGTSPDAMAELLSCSSAMEAKTLGLDRKQKELFGATKSTQNWHKELSITEENTFQFWILITWITWFHWNKRQAYRYSLSPGPICSFLKHVWKSL